MRSVLTILTIALGGAAMGQTTLTDNDCRVTLTNAFGNLRVIDSSYPSAYSYCLRLDTTQSIGSRTTNYTGWLKLFDDANPTDESIKAELTVYEGATLVQRTVADGVKVWSYDPIGNAYSVNAYNVESGPNVVNYRGGFINLFKETAMGTPQNLMALMDQASITGAARVKDWLGGLSFTGQQVIDANDPTHITNLIWQKLPDNSRFVQFNTETYDTGLTWTLNSVQIHKEDKIGTSTRVLDTYLTLAKDSNGFPLSYTKTSTDFTFVPPARSKVLASPRTIKF
ncbi:MAG: hypothetical protein JST12_03435 [Armatimonadetes bacterium]|nr:hypothetical protein [Armatimonadota bacterium]MBS1728823.1 hypothetical protein [Armatimonadota bacterium]